MIRHSLPPVSDQALGVGTKPCTSGSKAHVFPPLLNNLHPLKLLFIFMNREFIHMVQNSKSTKGYTVKTPSHPAFLPGTKLRCYFPCVFSEVLCVQATGTHTFPAFCLFIYISSVQVLKSLVHLHWAQGLQCLRPMILLGGCENVCVFLNQEKKMNF